jgi:hypothetical protein
VGWRLKGWLLFCAVLSIEEKRMPFAADFPFMMLLRRLKSPYL